jgi:hypothetical protein
MFPPVDTKDAAAVASFISDTFQRLHPGESTAWVNRLFTDIQDLFTGRRLEYAPLDLRYHDLEHTHQTTVCLSLLLEGRRQAAGEPHLRPRDTELAVAAALLHDSGYLKLRADVGGTGAKYTHCHVRRSCAFAVIYLQTLGVSDAEVSLVVSAINCTGPTREAPHGRSRDPIGRVIGSALGTADYLAQMGAHDYPDELDLLYAEFREADEFDQLPASECLFKSVSHLVEGTPAFWQTLVRPKLEVEFDRVYRFLANPYPNGRNRYLEAVESNIAEISRRIPCVSAPAK